MGIRGLYKYINEHADRYLEKYELANTKLIVDGSSIREQLFYRYEMYKFDNNNFDGIYRNFSKYVRHFFLNLIHDNVDMLVVLNGTWEIRNQDLVIEKFQYGIQDLQKLTFDKQISRNRDFPKHISDVSSNEQTNYNKNDLYCIMFKKEVFLNVMTDLKIKFIVCTYSAKNVIGTIAKILNYPVLTGDSELYLYRIDCVVFSSLKFHSRNDLNKKLTSNIFRPDKIVKKIPGLNIECLVFTQILLNPNYFTEKLLLRLLKIKSFDPKINMFQARFEAILSWLCGHTLNSAAQAIRSLMISIGDSQPFTKKLIQVTVNKYTVISTYMLHHFINLSSFSIDEKMILEAKNKFFEFEFNDRNESSKEMNENYLNYNYITQDDDVIKKKFAQSVPGWLIDDYLLGKYSPFIVNLIEHQIYMPLCQWENYKFPSIYEASIPLISLIYSLVTTCTNEEVKPLKLYIRENLTVRCKDLVVIKYPFHLEDLRTADNTIRLNVINRALGIIDATVIEDLPKKWRLFVVTAIFWLKQEGKPVKNRIHLHVLFLTLLSTIIEKKIRCPRDNNFFDDSFRKEVDNISDSSKIGNIKELSILHLLEEISYDDAVAAARDLLPIFENQEFYRYHNKNSTLAELSNLTIHIYQQFQCCLEHTKNINALLNYPYYQPIINEIFNGSMIYNLCMDISQHSMEDDDYIIYKLKNSPSVLKVFKLMTEQVNSFLK